MSCAEVAGYLLEHGYQLSALELLLEVQEEPPDSRSGDALEAIRALEAFFGDAARFPSESLRKFQGDDERRMAEFSREREQALQMTTYELRLAREDIQDLKDQLQRGASALPKAEGGGSLTTPPPANGGVHGGGAGAGGGAALTEHDVAVLNGAVAQYLLQRGYKMSAMTLGEECGNVVAEAHEPLEEYYANASARSELLKVQEERDALRVKAEGLESELARQIAEGAAKEAALRADLAAAEKGRVRLAGDVAGLKSRLELAKAAVGSNGGGGMPAAQPEAGARAGAGAGAGGGGTEGVDAGRAVADEEGNEATVFVVAEALPKIVPSVLIAKREELLPLFLCAIRQHPEVATRDALTNLLFNLIKRPNAAQRGMIMDSCVALASSIGELRTEEELLPQCWEQIPHKNPERRVLVAEFCGRLADHVRPDLRPSLLLSILQQLSEDPDPMVREAVAANLARIVGKIAGLDKFAQVQEIMMGLLLDPSDEVSAAASSLLLPALVQWARGGEPVLRVLGALLAKAVALVERSPGVVGVEGVGAAGLRLVGEAERWKLDALLKAFVAGLPAARALAMRTAPGGLGFGAGGEQGLAPEAADTLLVEYVRRGGASKGGAPWPAVDWLLEDAIPKVVFIAKMAAPPGEGREGAEAVRRRVCLTARALCHTAGAPFAAAVLQPVFGAASGGLWAPRACPPAVQALGEASLPLSAAACRAARLCVLPVMLAGVLPCAGPAALGKFVNGLVADDEVGGGGTWADAYPSEMVDAVAAAASFEDLQGALLDVLAGVASSPVGLVRAKAALLVRGLAAQLSAEKITLKVLPALAGLGTDPHAEVRMAAIGALGECAARYLRGSDPGARGKVQEMFDLFLEDGAHDVTMAVVRALAAGCRGNHEAFIEFALTRLQHVVLAFERLSGPRRAEAAGVAFEALRVIDTCEIGSETTHLHLLAALEAVWRVESLLEPDNAREMLAAMLADHSARAGRPPPSGGGGRGMGAGVGAGGVAGIGAGQPGDSEGGFKARMGSLFRSKPG